MIKKEITQKELSDLLAVSQPTLSKKFKLDDWRESDLQQIAEACHCKYEGSFLIGGERI